MSGKGDEEVRNLTSQLDQQILSALDDPDICKSKVSGNLESQTNSTDTVSDDSNEESDDYGDDEDMPASMGYVALPQDSDEDNDINEEEDVTHYPLTEATPVNTKALQDESPTASGQSSNNELNMVTPTPAPKLETKAVEQIKQAMSGFSIPSSSIPAWAKQVPEDIWKEELMKGLKERRTTKK